MKDRPKHGKVQFDGICQCLLSFFFCLQKYGTRMHINYVHPKARNRQQQQIGGGWEKCMLAT